MNIYDYVLKRGNQTFTDKEFNEVDNLVFSLLSYLNYTDTSINIRNHTIGYIGREYLKLKSFNEVKKLGPSQKDAYKLLEIVINAKRYKNIIIHDYVYSANVNKQFSAMMFKINKDLEYMCFEGTDELISGWKEDFEMSYMFPIPSQKDAINYANKHISISGPQIIIGGHSKGGNLALVATMYLKPLKQLKVKKIYSNDGPGLKTREFKSFRFRRIKKKYIHIVPQGSFIGMLLNNGRHYVIKSTKNNIMGHLIPYWVINKDKLVKEELSNKSIELEANFLKWSNNYTDKEKEKTVKTLFYALEKLDVPSIPELIKPSNLIKAIDNIHNIDSDSKSILIDLINYNLIKPIFKKERGNK